MVQKGLRPALPPGTPQPLANIMGQCWVREPQARPSFESLKEQLEVRGSWLWRFDSQNQMHFWWQSAWQRACCDYTDLLCDERPVSDMCPFMGSTEELLAANP